MAFSNSLSRERASLTKQARIYSEREQARIYVQSETEEQDREGEMRSREEEMKRMKATEKPRLLNVRAFFPANVISDNLIMQARQVNLGTGLTQIFITGEEASLEDISVASTEVTLPIIMIVTTVNKIMIMTSVTEMRIISRW